MKLDKERLRVLAEAATPGPWILLPIEDGSPYLRVRGTRLGARYKVANVLAPKYFMPRDGIESTANAEFIAAARDAVPALLSENAALAAEVERTSNNRDMWKAQCAVQAQEFERLSCGHRPACEECKGTTP